MVKKLMVFPSSSAAVASGHWFRLWTCPSFHRPGESQVVPQVGCDKALPCSCLHSTHPFRETSQQKRCNPDGSGVLQDNQSSWQPELPSEQHHSFPWLQQTWWPGSSFLGGQVKAEVVGEEKSCDQMVVSTAETETVKCEDGRNFLIIIFCSSRNLTTFWKFKLSPNFVSLF